MIQMKVLTDEQKKEIDELFNQLRKMDGAEFEVIEKPDYMAVYSSNPYVIKALILEAFVSLLKRKDK
jgi:ethanolamine utilization cobalamin adenosyltransferase